MIYQKCKKCGSEWNSIKSIKECPFCGNVFEMSTSSFSKIEDAFQYIFNTHGIEIIKQKNIFNSLLADYAPSLKKERRAIRMALDSGVYLELLSVEKNDSNSQSFAQTKAIKTLNNEYLMDSTQAKYAVGWLVSQLNWNSASAQNESVFIPCTETSSVNTNKTSQVVEQAKDDSKIGVGKKVLFGSYAFEEDGTPKPIEWEIIDVQKEKILLWSTMCIDVYPYNFQRKANSDWYHSDLRKYLFENMFIKAFNEYEKDTILTTETKPSYNPKSKRCDGKIKVFDKTFILSDEEFDYYQLRPFQLKGSATPYAKKIGIFCYADNDAYYWVRTPGAGEETQMFVGKGGQRVCGGAYVNISGRGIRPAVWVDRLKLNGMV